MSRRLSALCLYCLLSVGFFFIECKPGLFLAENTFFKPGENPILSADSSFQFVDPITNNTVLWQKADVFNPAAIVKDHQVYILYRCEDNPAAHLGGRTSRLGLARSDDGIHFTKHPVPVLFPDDDPYKKYEYPGGCEDPRLTQTEDGLYVLAYTAWNQDIARLSVAFSTDLIHWDKKGPAFAKAYQGKWLNTWSKSGSMITKMKGGRPVLAKINGKYWMYWGEQLINLAWSDNLYDWYPSLNADSTLAAVISPRRGYFDSHLTECGPPAIITQQGITLLYNGKNLSGSDASPDLPANTYSVGKLILDPGDPSKVLYRSDRPFMQPSLPHERSGQYAAGTTFAEGLVYFKKKWFLYYGTADSFVGLAVTR
ncbi:MAG: glycoside hydrolase family 130 protein [Saprospiraceae bacterium]